MSNKLTPPAWLPDWSNDSAYPTSFSDWNIVQWGWAFLRRNPEYQSDYALFAEMCALGEKSSDWWLMEKWDITYAPDPSKDELIAIPFEYALPPNVLQLHAPDIHGTMVPLPIDPDEPETMTIRFDIRYSIERQLEYAKYLLSELRESQGDCPEKIKSATPNKDMIPLYLRAYDAFLVGVGPRAIAKKLFPGKASSAASLRSADEAARRAIANGKSLVTSGYKDLLKFG